MPIFEYECAKCKKVFEVICSGGTSERVTCPECSSAKVNKLLSCFSVGSAATGAGPDGKSSNACTSCATRNCSSCG